MKIAVGLDAASETVVPVLSRVVVCLLGPGADPARIERLDRSAIRAALTDPPEPGFDRFPETADLVAEALAGQGGWRLHVSSDPAESIPLIHQMLDAIGHGDRGRT